MSRIRVLVVDDSIVAGMVVNDALAGDPQIEVVGTAANGRLALAMVEQLAPDRVTMDIVMPVMEGVKAAGALPRRGARLPVIMFTWISAQDAKATFKALAAGATDFVTKPAHMTSSVPTRPSSRLPKTSSLRSRRLWRSRNQPPVRQQPRTPRLRSLGAPQ